MNEGGCLSNSALGAGSLWWALTGLFSRLPAYARQAFFTFLSKMASAKVTCQIHVQKIEDNGRTQKIAMKSLRNCPDIGVELRIRWATELMKHFEQPPEPITSIRPWDFVAKMDGSVESLPNPVLTGDLCEGYPARFQIPSCTLDGLNHEEKVRRAEMFAMACLLYEIMSGRKPFEELADDKVQHRFMNGDVPNDAATLPNSLFMFSGWSEEFAQELQRRGLPHCRRLSKGSDDV